MMSIKGLGQKARVALTICLVTFSGQSALAQDGGGAEMGVVDQFHPDHVDGENLAPLYGGRVIVHLSSLPKNMCYPIENSAVTRRMLFEVHESMLSRDWETFKYEPCLVTAWDEEDMLVLKDGAAAKYPGAVVDVRVKDPEGKDGAQVDARVVYGKVEDMGDYYRVSPLSKASVLTEPLQVAREDVAHAELGTVFTFYLKDDVTWQPYTSPGGTTIEGHKLDAKDVMFSWKLYSNPGIDCDEKRYAFEKVTRGELIDDQTVRFFFESQYFGAISTLGQDMTIMPTHVYDLSDPDNPDFDESATEAQQAKFFNEHPANRLWVGLGPYRVTNYDQQWVQAERFDDYFDKDNAGYVDVIRWRMIDDDNAAMNALLNGELDYFERVKSADYFGEATQKPSFMDKFYKGYHYLGTYGYTGWNLYRPQLAEKEVRQALAHAFDSETYLKNNYKNLARQTTGPFPYNSPAYDHSVKAFEYDPELAIEMLEDAGWYDRDGDDIVDKDGVALTIDFMMPSGNDASKGLGLTMQEAFAEIGVKVNIVGFEWATFLDRFKKRDFDGANLAWVPDLESDPEPLWHSKWGEMGKQGSNNSGVREPELDRLIAAGQRELDFDKRQEVWRAMHRFIYDLQPYLFGFNVPSKFAMTKRIRGYKNYAVDPGYSIREWYFVDPAEPGTRTARTK